MIWYYMDEGNQNVGTSFTGPNVNEPITPCRSFCLYACKNPPEFNISSKPDLAGCVSKIKAVIQPATDVELIDLLEETNKEYAIEPVKMVKKLYKSCRNQVNEKRTMQPYWTYIFNEFNKLPVYTNHTTMLRNYLRITGHLPWFKYTIKSEYYGKAIILEFSASYNVQKIHSITGDLLAIKNIYPYFVNYESIGRFFNQISLLKKPHPGTFGAERFVYDSTTIRKVLPDLFLDRIFDDILKKSDKSVEKFTFTISDQKCFRDLNDLITGTNIQDFFIIVLLEVFQDFYAKFPILRKEFKAEETNTTSTQGTISQQRQYCLSTVQILSEILNWMHIEKGFDEQMKKKVKSIIDYLINATEYVLSETSFLDEESMKQALDKLETLKQNFYIGSEHSIIRKERILKDYANLNFTDNFVSDIFSLNKFYSNLLNMRMLHDEKNIVSQTDGLPAYTKRFHSIHVPLASLQLPLFTKDEYMVRNFGGLGFLIGREIFREFEIAGNNYSKGLWMSEYSYISYQNLTNYIINNFTRRQNVSQSTSVNGAKTANNIIADVFGLNVASQAFLLWKKDYANALENLPSHKTWNLKLFYTMLAQIFCSSEETNTHNYADHRTFAPNTARVHKLLQNSELFSKAFQCPQGASMNPQPKVEL
ncbi:membrane metallo-endopeptidase-like 1 [Octopus bimaculoides]|uniref:membrane metallo-endopeptidase-like 1 n=1 Tax=Octopus bimaculoides TaxID=37653 RepID=UPI00071CDF93|nr:membrane metallo-endopeptidase-like 1 [Octopus bimaculoides]|eukprot:XP_014772657.1 PREDICTED: membrane metallo-endopeptidase-like 1 [Octopus bimaculoides]